jgi:hypothetical protein
MALVTPGASAQGQQTVRAQDLTYEHRGSTDGHCCEATKRQNVLSAAHNVLHDGNWLVTVVRDLLSGSRRWQVLNLDLRVSELHAPQQRHVRHGCSSARGKLSTSWWRHLKVLNI